MPGNLFIQFAREPVPGAVKTRLVPAVTPEQACEIHTDLVRHTARVLVTAGLAEVRLDVSGDPGHPVFRECLALGVDGVRAQSGADLGERMLNALHHGLAAHERVVLVGSDCPQLDREYLGAALAALETCDVVVGPARDGGYVLIGVRCADSRWFEGVTWGTDRVYRQTATRLDASGATWQALAPLADVDRPEDLASWWALPRQR
jgi:rSAM/selenodomain-associated transferase 1